MSHSATLALAYAVACGAWWLLSRVLSLWRAPARPSFAHPWRDVGLVLLGVVAVLGLGQLWGFGVRLEAPGAWHPIAESVTQLVIFAPVLLVPILRRDGWSSAWIQLDRLPLRLGVGVGLTLLVLLIYSTVESGAAAWVAAVRDVFQPGRAHLAVQVLLEDIAIAILFVRLAAALSPRWAIVLVALVFAAGHIPAMLSEGASPAEFLGLIRDFGLGMLVTGTIWRGADIAWFWPVHFALDMTQFIGRAA